MAKIPIIDSREELLGCTPTSRQFVVSVDSESDASEILGSDYLRIGAKVAGHLATLAIPGSFLVTRLAGLVLGETLSRATDFIAPSGDDLDFTFITSSLAHTLGLSPSRKKVFARHPLTEMIYFNVPEFHEALFHDRIAELSDILAALGAKSYQIEAAEEAGRTGKVNASANAAGETADFSANGSKKHGRFAGLQATFGKPSSGPKLPNGLAWYHKDRLWQAMAKARIEHHQITYELNLNSTDEHGVSAQIVSKLKGCGLDIGGEFTEINRRNLKVKIEFWPTTSD